MGVIEQSRNLTAVFPEKSLGHITICVEPINASMSLGMTLDYFKQDDEITSIPVEKDGGVMGLVARETVTAKSKSAWEQIVHRDLDSYIDTDAPIFDSRENCEKVVARLTEEGYHGGGVDLLVFHRGRYFGIVPFQRLMQHVSSLRRHELNYARELQDFLMQRGGTSKKGYYYEILLRMSHELGGDFYQTLQLNDNLAMVACFDVSGKSIAASLSTTIISSYFATLEVTNQTRGMEGEEILKGLNNVLGTTTPMDVFVVGVVYLIDSQKDTVSIYNFGYSPVYIISTEAGKGKIATSEPTLPPLGIEEITDPSVLIAGRRSIKIRNNLKFVTYSDGLTDLENQLGRQYGQERVDEFIKEHFADEAREFIAALEREIDEFQGKAPQADDITVLALQF